MMNQKQMELELAGANRCPRTVQRERRLNRANWWFSQMRQVVDRALDWEPAPRFQSQQVLLGEDRHHQ
jgi:hypothetical protein